MMNYIGQVVGEIPPQTEGCIKSIGNHLSYLTVQGGSNSFLWKLSIMEKILKITVEPHPEYPGALRVAFWEKGTWRELHNHSISCEVVEGNLAYLNDYFNPPRAARVLNKIQSFMNALNGCQFNKYNTIKTAPFPRAIGILAAMNIMGFDINWNKIFTLAYTQRVSLKQRAVAVAMCSAYHPRLGANASTRNFPPPVLQHILGFAYSPPIQANTTPLEKAVLEILAHDTLDGVLTAYQRAEKIKHPRVEPPPFTCRVM